MTPDKDSMALATIGDLSAYFEPAHDTEESLSRRVYKGTDCGAWLSLAWPEGVSFGKHDELSPDLRPVSLTIGSIVEGSEAAFERTIALPATGGDVRGWLEELETMCDEEWTEANSGDEDATEA